MNIPDSKWFNIYCIWAKDGQICAFVRVYNFLKSWKMSDKLIIMLLLLSFDISAGELTWYTADKTYYMGNCELRGQSNSDLNNFNEYYLNCDQTPTSIFSSNSGTSRSIANVNGQYFLRCEADAIINSNTDFYLNFNCSDLIYRNGFDL